MTSKQVMTLDNPAGLLLTPELLQKIGVRAGDQIKVSVRERVLIIRPVNDAPTEGEWSAGPLDAGIIGDEATVTFRELIKEELADRGIAGVAEVKIILANGQELLFANAEDQRLDETVKRIDVKEVILKQSAKASGQRMDEIMRDLLERRRGLYERLAEGPK